MSHPPSRRMSGFAPKGCGRAAARTTALGLTLLAGAASSALALGITRVPATAVLGQPLDVSVSVQLAPGERLPAECISAEVWVGEQRLPPGSVRVQFDGQGSLRIGSALVVGEPVVQVSLSLGCVNRVSRSFTLLADPPVATSTAVPAPAVASLAPPLANAPLPAAAAAAAAGVAAPEASNPAPGPTPASASSSGAAPVPAAQPDAASASAAAKDPPRASRSAAASRPARASRPQARLELDPPQLPVQSPAVAAAQDKAAALSAAAAALGSEPPPVAAAASEEDAAMLEARLTELEKSVADMLVQAKAQLALQQAAQLRTQQELAQAQQRNRWMPWLQALVIALLGGLAIAAWHIRRSARPKAAWFDAQTPGNATPAPAPATAVALARAASSPTAAQPALKPARTPVFPLRRGDSPVPAAQAASMQERERASTPVPSMEQTAVLSAAAVAQAKAGTAGGTASVADSEAVAIEELIDLEQQVAFFSLLGQDEAAVDLIVAHLRQGGVVSPLPYLKLLELHHRMGDAEAYERTRNRFEKRFAASAPAWGQDLAGGRELERYPLVMARVQQVWAQPLDAMALLQNLLARTDGGEVFDLPAYRDLMLLYPLARQLAGIEPARGSNMTEVDLLLPLGEEAPDTGAAVFSTTTSFPYRVGTSDPGPGWESRPTAPVDLELELPATQTGSKVASAA
jgi:pilus assembly protein FimV